MHKNHSLLEAIKLLSENKLASITAIIVAIFGCTATIIAATVSGLFDYLGVQTQMEKPVSLTQAAINLQSTVVAEISMKSSTVIPTAPQSVIFSPIESPAIQAEIIFPTEAVLLPTGMPEVEIDEINWTRIITYYIETPCGYFVLPSQLVNEENPASWIQDNFSYLLNNQNSYLFSADPGLSGTFSLVLNLTNITSEQFWVNIDNDLPVKVHYADELQQDATIYRQGGCGGGGFIRYFSVVPLKSDFIEYDILSSSTDADYFTLEPGESEMFSLSFTCQSPGIYGLKISIPITYKQTDGIIDIPIVNGVVCPERISTYEVDSLGEGWFVYDSAVYYWDGSEYIKE